MNAVVRWLDEGPGNSGSSGTLGAPNIPENWSYVVYDQFGTVLMTEPTAQLLHAQGMARIKQVYVKHALMHPPGIVVCGTYTTHYSFSATYCTQDGVTLKLGTVQFPGKPARVSRPTVPGPVVAVGPFAPPPPVFFTPGAGTFAPAQPNVFARAALAPIAILSGSGDGTLGVLSPDWVQAKNLLLLWTKLSGMSCLADYGMNPKDSISISWTNRDGMQLQCFRNWWNKSGKLPPIAVWDVTNFYGTATPILADVEALKSWASKLPAITVRSFLPKAETVAFAQSRPVSRPDARWLRGPGDGTLGVSFQDAVAGKTILLSWSKLSGATCVLDYGLNPLYPNDIDVNSWSQRDGTQLQCFRNWWNQSGFQPPIALIPDNFGASSTLTDADVVSLKLWASQQVIPPPVIIPYETAPPAPPPPPPVTAPPPDQPALPPPPAPIQSAKPEEKKDRTGLYVLGAVALVGIGIFALTVAARGAGGGAMLAASNPGRRRANQDMSPRTLAKPRAGLISARSAPRANRKRRRSRRRRANADLDNPHTRGCAVVTTVGDVNPIEYGGGYLFRCKVHGQDNLVVEYTHGTEDAEGTSDLSEFDPAYSRIPLTLYRVYLPNDVWAEHNWADVDAIAASYDADPAELRRAGSSSDPRERLYALESIAGHNGWHELDTYPLTLTVSELRKRWYRASRSK